MKLLSVEWKKANIREQSYKINTEITIHLQKYFSN